MAGIIHAMHGLSKQLVHITTDNLGNALAYNRGRAKGVTHNRILRACSHHLLALLSDIIASFAPRQITGLADALSKATTLEEAQFYADAFCRACSIDKITVIHAPVFSISETGDPIVTHVCSTACRGCKGIVHSC